MKVSNPLNSNNHNKITKKYSSYRGFNCIHAQSMPCMFERIFTLDYILLFTGICCVCALTMLGIYGRIYMIARKHSKQIAKIHSILIQQQQHPPTAAHVSKSVGDELGRMSSTPTGLEQDFYEMGKLGFSAYFTHTIFIYHYLFFFSQRKKAE